MKNVLLIMLCTIITFVTVLIVGSSMSANNEIAEDNEVKDWGPASEGCQLSIEAEKYKFNYCQPIALKVTIRNSGTKQISFADTSPYYDFTVTVINDKGESVPLTAYGKHITSNRGNSRNVMIQLDPGQKREYFLLVNRMHDMSFKGIYSITVKRSVFKRDGEGLAEVVSNTIEVEVKGDPPNPFEDSKSE